MSALTQRTYAADRIAITFDVDWAPDWCVELCLSACRKREVPATFFATHKSDILEDIRRDPMFELGIHPNFLPGSSHGKTRQEVLDHCLDIVPEACAMRTHGLYQDSSLLHLIGNEYPQITCDVSLFMPFHDNLQATKFPAGQPPRALIRLPYYWEDDIACLWPDHQWSKPLPEGSGLRIFNFHPIYVGLNAKDLDTYERLKASLEGPLTNVPFEACKNLINEGEGIGTFLKILTETAPSSDFFTVSALAEEVLEGLS